MINKYQEKSSGDHECPDQSEGLNLLSSQILQMANSGMTRTYFLRKTLRLMLEFFNADEINLLLREYDDSTRFELIKYSPDDFRFNFFPQLNNASFHDYGTALDEHWNYILSGNINKSVSFVTKGGGLWIRMLDNQIIKNDFIREIQLDKYFAAGELKCLFITPFLLDNERIGLFELKSSNEKFLCDFDIDFIETFVHTLGMTLLNQHTQAALQERVKELSCLYGMSQIAETPYVSLDDLIYSIMDLIPPAWQYPEITRTRIILDGIDYSLPDFESNDNKLASDIMIDNKKRGEIEIIYTRERPEFDEGPFLKEERKLLDTVAKELAMIIKRRESEEDKNRLQNQLHHADRLATVGELAAGLAHEINEPLGSILGFAQLAGKYHGVPDQVKKDLEKIVRSSLHAREIVKKMTLFSRQVTAQKKQIDINQVIEDSLYFYKSRCQKEGIKLNIKLQPDLPFIIADPVHINQVVVNIVVNAMQAMPHGGALNIKTLTSADEIMLIIKDTGVGMKEEVMEQIFDPFFTTKKAGQGLGLGLSVVHGIITTHGGSISVISEPGKGTEFKISLPINLPAASNASE
jgi:signal transduction histidine kinase